MGDLVGERHIAGETGETRNVARNLKQPEERLFRNYVFLLDVLGPSNTLKDCMQVAAGFKKSFSDQEWWCRAR